MKKLIVLSLFITSCSTYKASEPIESYYYDTTDLVLPDIDWSDTLVFYETL
jgi:hypothetical protein